MHEFGAFEGKNKFGHLLDLVEAGKEIVITRHGRPVARISPVSGVSAERIGAAKAAAERIRARATARRTGPFDWQEWKSYRDEGRR
jgi:prevent-host-death family protein